MFDGEQGCRYARAIGKIVRSDLEELEHVEIWYMVPFFLQGLS